MATDIGSQHDRPGTLYPDFARNRFLGVALLAVGLVGVIPLVLHGAAAAGGVGPAVVRGLYDLFWVFCGAAYLQHPHTRLRALMRRSAVASLSLFGLVILGRLVYSLVVGDL